jgi:hypothetical protein
MTFETRIKNTIDEIFKKSNFIDTTLTTEKIEYLIKVISEQFDNKPKGNILIKFNEKNEIVPCDLWTALLLLGKDVLNYDNSIEEFKQSEGTYIFVNNQLFLKSNKPIDFIQFEFNIKEN